ncbi:hypothetical protein INS49_005295 [Diaporthe citri]|uniref:uncharacterized protein n=1 Tax=Diaporthe citri TaxID=83186 RepID=UPI001C7F6B58|nr:uncharacterized protein INS49_005295 [Diaporthe citri]KAG6353814.1 hypothetical protein INS49_005295 [Diaporthe citri]
MRLATPLVLIALVAAAGGVSDITDEVVNRDVVVVGGGASGAHAAVKLRDMGKTIMLVEKRDRLGGLTETCLVSVFPLVTTTKYVDFTTGRALDNYTAPTSAEALAALKTYHGLCKRYEQLLLPGYFDFPLPGEIPEDFTLLFRDFVARYNISAAVPRLFQLTGVGLGDMMNIPTMYVMQGKGAPLTGVLFGETSNVVPVSGDNHELYRKIGDLLGQDVLYSSTVMSSVRGADDTGVTVVVEAANGNRKRIRAQRLLIAIEPSTDNMAPFDLDASESAVFSKFRPSNVYVGAVRNPSLVVNQSLTNMPAAAEPSNWTALPLPPFNSRFDYFG